MQPAHDLFDEGIRSWATFSKDRPHRYDLWRRWGSGAYCLFICLNPSTADEVRNDPTVTRCIDYSRRWGFDAFCMSNIFAFRATEPEDMKAALDPIGPENDTHLLKLARDAGIVVAGWGAHGDFMGRAEQVRKLMADAGVTLHCLHRTKGGHPGHPLYLSKNLRPVPL